MRCSRISTCSRYALPLSAQSLDPAKLLQPPTDTWPTYNGDYSGRRFSTLNEDQRFEHELAQPRPGYIARCGRRAASAEPSRRRPLLVNGVLYFTIPDHVWAIDARTGREIWHFDWQSKGGIHIGNRGVGVYGNWLYFETPDCNLVSLNMKDGKERWHKPICDLDQMYFGSVAPVVIKNHVIIGVSGDDLDIPAIWNRTIRKRAICNGAGTRIPKPGEPGVEDAGPMPKRCCMAAA